MPRRNRVTPKANSEIAGTPRPAATTLDAVLHQERTATGSQSHRFCNSIEDLPDGAFVTDNGKTAYLVLGNQLLRWTPAGYEQPPVRTTPYPVRVLTPASVLRTLAAGYPVTNTAVLVDLAMPGSLPEATAEAAIRVLPLRIFLPVVVKDYGG